MVESVEEVGRQGRADRSERREGVVGRFKASQAVATSDESSLTAGA